MHQAVTTRRTQVSKVHGAILLLVLVSSVAAWAMIAWPVLVFANVADHPGHFAMTFAHMIGGTGMMLFGGLNLYLALRKSMYRLHRWSGRAYLVLGSFGSLTAILVTLSPAHKSAGELLTNSTVSLLMLAVAWLAFAAMGLRAARNRRFVSHGQWMIRSYVLVWSFVFCRIASRATGLDDAVGADAFIWLAWVLPLLLAEIGIQWSEGAARPARTSRS